MKKFKDLRAFGALLLSCKKQTGFRFYLILRQNLNNTKAEIWKSQVQDEKISINDIFLSFGKCKVIS